jgi:hypothetical protein
MFVAARSAFAGRDKDLLRYVPSVENVTPLPGSTCDDFKATVTGQNVGTKTGLVFTGTFVAQKSPTQRQQKRAVTSITLEIKYTDGAMHLFKAEVIEGQQRPLVTQADTKGPNSYVVTFQEAVRSHLADMLMNACDFVATRSGECLSKRLLSNSAHPRP